MSLRPLTLFGSKVSFTNQRSINSRPTWWNPSRPIFRAGCSKRTSRQPRISSGHARWGGTGRVNLPCPLQSVCYSHALTLELPRVSSLRGWNGHHSHVLQAGAGHQLPGSIPQRPRAVGERMEDRQRCLEELCDVLHEGRNAFLQAPTSTAVRGTYPVCRSYSLSGGDPRYAAVPVA